MARKGGASGLDISLLFSNLILTATLGLAVIGWIVAFVGQIAAEAQNRRQGVLWFSIFLQLFIILIAAYSIATNSVSSASFQISFFLTILVVFSVIGINQGLYSGQSSREAATAGWFILAIVNIIWLLYFTSEEDTLVYSLLNRFGNGALNGPGGRRGHLGGGVGGGGGGGTASRMGDSHEGAAYSGGFVNSHQAGSGGYQPAYRSSASDLNGNANKSNGMAAGAGSIRSGHTNPNAGGVANYSAGSDHGRGTSLDKQSASGAADGTGEPSAGYGYRAKALYAYQANADDPTEISFSKGEMLDIVDNSGKWWQARKATGETGIVPSNYMQVL